MTHSDREAAVALLSGGLDSTVSLALAFERFRPITAIFADYGQHASEREEEAAGAVAAHYGLSFQRIDLTWLGSVSRSSLVKGKGEPPEIDADDLDRPPGPDVPSVWVENRNGIFINAAAAYAVASNSGIVIVGFNREEANAFPDNSAGYIAAANAALELGAGSPVEVVSPTIGMSKAEIVREGIRLAIPWTFLWSCYRGGRLMCGVCESCARFRRAIAGTPVERDMTFEKEQM
jgi:7-cyano-7-deazaguanine synthase